MSRRADDWWVVFKGYGAVAHSCWPRLPKPIAVYVIGIAWVCLAPLTMFVVLVALVLSPILLIIAAVENGKDPR